MKIKVPHTVVVDAIVDTETGEVEEVRVVAESVQRTYKEPIMTTDPGQVFVPAEEAAAAERIAASTPWPIW